MNRFPALALVAALLALPALAGEEDQVNYAVHELMAGRAAPAWSIVDPDGPGLTPNKKHGAHIVKYTLDPAGWRQRLITWYDEEARTGHSHQEQTGSYDQFRARYDALAWRTARRARHLDVQQRVLRRVLSQQALQELGEHGGRVYLPGARAGDAVSDVRDAVHLMRGEGRVPSKPAAWWEHSSESRQGIRQWTHDGAALWRALIDAGEYRSVPAGDRWLPKLRSLMVVERRRDGRLLYLPDLGAAYGGPWWSVGLHDQRGRLGELDVSWRTLFGPGGWKRGQSMGGGSISRSGVSEAELLTRADRLLGPVVSRRVVGVEPAPLPDADLVVAAGGLVGDEPDQEPVEACEALTEALSAIRAAREAVCQP